MKRSLVILFMGCAIIFSCTKTAVSISRHDLAGTWNLKRISGGLAGIDSVPADNISITFESSGNYKEVFDYAITATGNYSISKAGEPNYYFSETLLNLFPSDSSELTYGLLISNDSLFLDEGCCDRYSYTYVKQK